MNPAPTHPRNDLALAEAALFLSPHPVSRRALAKILGDVALSYVDQLLEDLREEFTDARRGIELHIDEGRAMLRVKPEYVNEVSHLAPQQDIPRPILRTLAVIAYNHPMTQADLVKVRGNKAYAHVQDLIERRLIVAEDHGRTLQLSVTKTFLQHFGLRNVEEFRFHFASDPSVKDAERVPEGASEPAPETTSGSPPNAAEDDEIGESGMTISSRRQDP